ncbi:hypothetical protein [Rathayibacter soli]|uniref:hypothetical protein n=1 Tax=Rathayibacter soli TaxID=3144168 RepID=UPI0027E5BDE2|nr:hypothetical protein [Glaciibacter superstes]
MANFVVAGYDQPLQPPPPVTAKPGAPSKIVPTQAGNANDGGALWWDHDDPGQGGARGTGGTWGVPGAPGGNGGSTPPGVRFTISQTINGSFSIELDGGRGQLGGKGGPGGDGGEGQDGGNSDDEQPAGPGGQGGDGGQGGPGGQGGKGGDINEFDLTIGVSIATSQLAVSYNQGRAGGGGDGGDYGNGGPGGKSGDNGPRMINGSPGNIGPRGAAGIDGIVDTLRVVA